ncbi:uncharacterized protein TNCV_4410021 [Trichonephila clavipes]|nr:uncharacterized protein TNCV_4410021 [Trichonephila clavipes]
MSALVLFRLPLVQKDTHFAEFLGVIHSKFLGVLQFIFMSHHELFYVILVHFQFQISSSCENSIHNFRSVSLITSEVGSNFRIIPEQRFSGMENVAEFLENIDNNLTYYEITTQLACAYLKGHLTERALDWFEALGYSVVEDKATYYTYLKQSLTKQFPVVRNRSELKTRFYASSQKHNQKPSDFLYKLLKVDK